MDSRGKVRRSIVAVLIGVLIGGGLLAVTPAGAEVAQVATNWKKIWKKKLQPQADKRYYTKSASDAKYATKTATSSAFANLYTKAESDAKYQLKGNYALAGSSYTKAESDAKYAPYPSVIRGTYSIIGPATTAGQELATEMSFGVVLPAAPTVHYINRGAAAPAGCSGTVEAPNADPGHLCVFEAQNVNVTQRNVIDASGFFGQASRFGASAIISATAAGAVYVYGSWAVRPGGAVTSAATAVSPSTTGGARAGN